MYITVRERQILEILLASKKQHTVKEIAEEMNVSERTIHRDLKGIEKIIKQFKLTLIKKSGVGIQLIGEQEQMGNLRLFLYNLNLHEYAPEERQIIISCTLLEASEPLKLVSLANELNVTVATISNDLDKVEDKLKKYSGLSLIRKRGYGVEIVGDERSKRKAMSDIITKNIDEVDLLTIIKENMQKKAMQQSDSLSERVLGLVDKRNLLTVEKIMEEMNNELPFSLADSAHVGLVVHLALAMERIVRGENITIDPIYLDKLEHTVEYKIAEKIGEKLELAFQTAVPKAEIGYITMHLNGAKLRHDKEYIIQDESDLHTVMIAKKLIRYVEQQTNQSLENHPSLLHGLITHLKPALYRIEKNMGISNPLIDKIKKEYGELFQLIKEATDTIFTTVEVPDEEVGYLVLHFGAVLLNKKDKNTFKALVVCSSGIGTSRMLATRIQKELPAIHEVKNISMFELQQINKEEYDIIVSTIRLPEMDMDYILVNPFLTKADVAKIKEYFAKQTAYELQKIDYKLPFVKEGDYIEDKNEISIRMEKWKDAINSTLTIIENFEVFPIKMKLNIKEILEQVCMYMFEKGKITDPNILVNDLLNREKLGGLGIPNTKLALYHTRSKVVNHPLFIVVTLSESIAIRAMDETTMMANNLLIMLSPTNISSGVLEVLSEISASIIENERSISTFESQNELLIGNYLATKLERYCFQKIIEEKQ